MRVLVLEGEPGAAADAADRLVDAGHQVSRCHEPGARPFPCNGLIDGQRCPLEEENVDAAVVVRGQSHVDPTASEDGVRCALRRYIPLVVVGRNEQSPYLDWATAISQGPETVVTAVEHAVAAPLPRHEAAAAKSLREALDTHGLPEIQADARVRHRGGDLHVMLIPSGPVPSIVAEMASVRAAGAIRSFDTYASVIDVIVEPAEEAKATESLSLGD